MCCACGDLHGCDRTAAYPAPSLCCALPTPQVARYEAGQAKGDPNAVPPVECQDPAITTFPEDRQQPEPPQTVPCVATPHGYLLGLIYQGTYCNVLPEPPQGPGGTRGGGGGGGGSGGGGGR